jgi:hypothetical protein
MMHFATSEKSWLRPIARCQTRLTCAAFPKLPNRSGCLNLPALAGCLVGAFVFPHLNRGWRPAPDTFARLIGAKGGLEYRGFPGFTAIIVKRIQNQADEDSIF